MECVDRYAAALVVQFIKRAQALPRSRRAGTLRKQAGSTSSPGAELFAQILRGAVNAGPVLKFRVPGVPDIVLVHADIAFVETLQLAGWALLDPLPDAPFAKVAPGGRQRPFSTI